MEALPWAGTLKAEREMRKRQSISWRLFDLKAATNHADNQALHVHAAIYAGAHGVGV
jgi:hypothetical protein